MLLGLSRCVLGWFCTVLGVVLECFWDVFGDVSGDVLGMFWHIFPMILGDFKSIFGGCFQGFPGWFWGIFGVALSSFRGRSEVFQVLPGVPWRGGGGLIPTLAASVAVRRAPKNCGVLQKPRARNRPFFGLRLGFFWHKPLPKNKK